MLQVLKQFRQFVKREKTNGGIYKKWEDATKPVIIGRYHIAYFPFEKVGIGSRGFVCDEKRSSACDSYCCSNRLSIPINPVEAVFLSSATDMPLSSILEFGSPQTYTLENGKAYVSTVFKLKMENGYCIFNDRPNSNKCKEYSNRTLQCRMYPFVYVESLGLVQRKSCPGFGKGPIATYDDMQHFTEIGILVSLLDSVLFEVEPNDLFGKRYEKIGNEIWNRMHIDPDRIIEIPTKNSFHQYVESEKRIANLGEELEGRRIDQSYFEDFMFKYFSSDKTLEVVAHTIS